jgi:uncharacterized membrane protein
MGVGVLMQAIKGFLTITAILTFTIAAWYVLALFVRGFLGSVARSAGWGA